jgi:lipoate-protein ligase A
MKASKMTDLSAAWRLIPIETNNGLLNMALDEAILMQAIKGKSPNTIRLYKWNPSTISIGRHQSLSDEVDLEAVRQLNFNVVRRITGGGAVFHDSKREITYSIVCPVKYLKELKAYSVLEQFELIESGIIDGLINYGLEPEKGIIHCPALFLDGKKFSGNAQLRRKNYLLQHGTILLEIEPELMYSVLKAPHNVSKSRMVKSVYAKCVGIKEKLDNYEEESFLISLRKGFEKSLQINLREGIYTQEELEIAEKLVIEKYSNQKWLFKYK